MIRETDIEKYLKKLVEDKEGFVGNLQVQLVVFLTVWFYYLQGSLLFVK